MIDDAAHDGPTTTVHGPTELLIDVQEALERAGWNILNISNGGPTAHVTVAGDCPLLDLFTGPPWGYRIEA